jgi:AraC-like DNA-binding protein
MKPYIEKLSMPDGQSCALLNRRLDDEIPFQWHYHREYELTLTLNSNGQRFVGDHVGTYDEGDLVLLGPNLPHTWASRSKPVEGEPHVALVAWFRPEWIDKLTETVGELSILKPMLLEASRGVRFSNAAASAVRPAIEAMAMLDPAKRFFALLEVLVTLSNDGGAAALASPGRRQQAYSMTDRPRIERVLDHIHAHYHERLAIDDLAEVAHLSPSGLHRMFRRHTQMTTLDYVAQLRVGRACQLLISTSRPIAHIAADVGYDNLSHFNRQFRSLKRTTPRSFRQGFAC